jgi:AcrR family transcriptional regulator
MEHADMAVLPPPSRRVQGKQDRRTRIIDAADALLREHGIAVVSVKMIAERARVSPATVYNLFATRGAVLDQVFERGLVELRSLVDALPSADALDRLFDAVTLSVELFGRDRAFYRATISTRAVSSGPGGHVTAPEIIAPRMRFWIGMVERIMQEGHLRPQARPALLGVLLTQIVVGTLSDWVWELIADARFALEVQYGFAVVLAHDAGPAAADRMAARLSALKAELGCAR